MVWRSWFLWVGLWSFKNILFRWGGFLLHDVKQFFTRPGIEYQNMDKTYIIGAKTQASLVLNYMAFRAWSLNSFPWCTSDSVAIEFNETACNNGVLLSQWFIVCKEDDTLLTLLSTRLNTILDEICWSTPLIFRACSCSFYSTKKCLYPITLGFYFKAENRHYIILLEDVLRE